MKPCLELKLYTPKNIKNCKKLCVSTNTLFEGDCNESTSSPNSDNRHYHTLVIVKYTENAYEF